jgi:hypothetical protein
MRTCVLAVFAAVAALAAGCTGSSAPPPPKPSATSAVATAAPRKVDPRSVTAKDALGDFTTFAPCSVLDLTNLPATFSEYGAPRVVWSQDIDQCTVEVPVAANGSMELDWGELTDGELIHRTDMLQVEDLDGGLELLYALDEPGHCAQYLRFDDHVVMDLDVYLDAGKQTSLCATGKEVVEAMAKTLVAKPAAHRLVRDVSLLHQDACRLLSPDIPAMLPGRNAVVSTDATLTHHDCAYDGPGGQSVWLYFGSMGADPKPQEGGKVITVAGRSTAQDQRSTANDSSCTLRTASIPLAGDGSSANLTYEGLVLTVSVKGKSSTVCADAVKLANKVWPKLPKT